MITLDMIAGMEIVKRHPHIQCYVCGRQGKNNLFLFPPDAIVAAYAYFVDCGHMEQRAKSGAWVSCEAHASVQAYLQLLDPELEDG